MSSTSTPAAEEPGGGRVYDRTFWLAYAANVSLVTANALTFRFAELVAWLGGTEEIAGRIVGAGMVGALLARFVLGQAIDYYGVRLLWALSGLLVVAGGLGYATAGDVGWPLYASRIAFTVGLAGAMTCSMVHIQNHVPAARRTEIIGMLGSSGFVGMILGAQAGDWILHSIPSGRFRYYVLFGSATFLALLYVVLALLLTRNDAHARPHETPALHRLLFRYWPGPVVLVAIMMGITFTVISVFLTRFATTLGLGGIGPFFTGYAISAFVFRLLGSSFSNRIGRHRMILLGLGGQCLGCALLTTVTEWWQLILPSLTMGFGHALLFPAVVSIGAGAFPKQYRGSGTTLVLGFTEVGVMIGAPILGAVIDHVSFRAMFLTASGIALGIGLVYGLTAARKPDEDHPEVDQSTVVPAAEKSRPRKVATATACDRTNRAS